MRRAFASALAISGAAAVLGACNGVLGIDAATREPVDASAPLDAGHDATVGDAGAGDAGAGDAGAGTGADAASTYTLSCANYCDVIAANCRQTPTEDDLEYLSENVCLSICPLFDAVPVAGGVIDPNEATPMTDTLNCRIWHANAAAVTGDAHTHCPHAGPLGGDMCQDLPGGACEEFCNLDLAICTGSNAAYASLEDCLDACQPDGGYPGFPYQVNPGDPEVSDLQATGNTLNCRMYHLENYLFTGDAVHCTHTSQSGGGVCVDSDD